MPLVDPVTMSSSPSAKGAKAAPQTKDAAPGFSAPARLLPVQIKPSLAAQTARHALPALLAAVYAVRFPAIVSDPVPAMASTLPVVAALQVVYAILCLPAAGSPAAAAKPAKKIRPGEKKKAAGDGPTGITSALLSLLLTALVIPFLYFAFVCFGAPAYTFVPHTALCAAHLAVLTLFPLFYVHGVDGAAWAAVGSFHAPYDETFGGCVGGFVGAWLGAVPIPLDWDREWQRWPVTILCGLYGGYLAGRVLGGTVFWGKRGAA